VFFKKKQKKFREPDATAVFTTRYVINDTRPITYVTHEEEDGAWQFFSSDEFDDFGKVAMVVALKEILALDPSLLQLADMPVGHYAVRETSDHNWIIKKRVKQPPAK
jgi:hypothetical protein